MDGFQSIPVYARERKATGELKAEKFLYLMWEPRIVVASESEYDIVFKRHSRAAGLFVLEDYDRLHQFEGYQTFAESSGSASGSFDGYPDYFEGEVGETEIDTAGGAAASREAGRVIAIGADDSGMERSEYPTVGMVLTMSFFEEDVNLEVETTESGSNKIVKMRVSLAAALAAGESRIGKFRVTMYDGANRASAYEVLNIYFAAASPEQVRTARDIDIVANDFVADVAADSTVAGGAGPLFHATETQLFGRPSAAYARGMAEFGLTFFINNDANPPTARLGILPGFAEVTDPARTNSPLRFKPVPPGVSLRLTVWGKPRGRTPETIYSFHQITSQYGAGPGEFADSRACQLRNAINAGDVSAVRTLAQAHGVALGDFADFHPLHYAMSQSDPEGPHRPPIRSSRRNLGEVTISIRPDVVEIVRLLLAGDSGGGVSANDLDGENVPALVYAINNMRVDCLPNPNSCDTHGVVVREQALVVSLLMENRADPSLGTGTTDGMALENDHEAIHTAVRWWGFGLLPALEEMLRPGQNRKTPSMESNKPASSKFSGQPAETPLHRFIGHRGSGFREHWQDGRFDNIRYEAMRSVVKLMKNLGGDCHRDGSGNHEHGVSDQFTSLCDLTADSP